MIHCSKKIRLSRSVAFSPNGKHLAIVLANGELLLHDMITGHTHTLAEGDGLDGVRLGDYRRLFPVRRLSVGPGPRT